MLMSNLKHGMKLSFSGFPSQYKDISDTTYCTCMEALWFGIPEEIEMSTVSVHGEKEEKNHVSKHINIGQHTVYTTMILLNSTTQVLTGRDIG